jgi:RHS repeat-associated protein
MLEETHYYPFGLTMHGISSKAAGGMENRYKFNEGTEFNNDFDISLYETPFRGYDAQLGRFWQIDPMADGFEDLSQYIFANDNPILLNDPLGLFADNPDDPKGDLAKEKTLSEVVVKSYTRSQKTNLYWDLRNQNIPISRVSNVHLKEWLYRQDAIQRHMEKVYQRQREEDLYIYGTLVAPVVIVEYGGVLLYQGGNYLVRVGTRLIPLARVKAMDLSLKLWRGTNIFLNNRKKEVYAAIAQQFKDNPAKWEKIMKSGEKVMDFTKPIQKALDKGVRKIDDLFDL